MANIGSVEKEAKTRKKQRIRDGARGGGTFLCRGPITEKFRPGLLNGDKIEYLGEEKGKKGKMMKTPFETVANGHLSLHSLM